MTSPSTQFILRDTKELQIRGLTRVHARRQIEHLRRGPASLDILRPCRKNDGIRVLTSNDKRRFAFRHAASQKAGRFMKFVPASGAATRLFAELQKFHSQYPRATMADVRAVVRKDPKAKDVLVFLQNLRRFPFYAALKRQVKNTNDPSAVLSAVLKNYAGMPKALLPFHRAPGGARTALEEHWIEAKDYIRSDDNVCRLHVTAAPGQESLFKRFTDAKRRFYEKKGGCRLKVDFSSQHPSTETVALDKNGRPFRQSDGRLLFRPGGHGALLQNLARAKADVAFIKNIDNVAAGRWRKKAVEWKKYLGGCLLTLQDGIFWRLSALREKKNDARLIKSTLRFIQEELSVKVPPKIERAPLARQRLYCLDRLDRPLRVCGMIENRGEPGGGPFWVKQKSGEAAVQILESAQITGAHKSLLKKASHFNPVDMVCGLEDGAGRPYNLEKFSDPRQIFIVEKHHQGQPLRGLEWPGLWNGGMGLWNTVFVEVPADTFQPVKTINDLLRPAHRTL
jgi:hypothetical protein